MARMRKRISRGMLFTWFLLAGLIVLFVPQSITNKFQLSFSRIFQLPLSVGRGLTLSARTPTSLPQNGQNRKLENHIANLEEQIRQERQKFEQLSGVADRLPFEGYHLVAANIFVNKGGLRGELVINRGKNQGLAPGQFVLGINSIIGTISSVLDNTAKVRLISDPESTLKIKIGSLGIGGVIQGSGTNLSKIPNLLVDKHLVKAGDVIYAQAKIGFLGDPMIAGQITKCGIDPVSPYCWDITVEPVCDIENLQSVHVIIMNGQ
ncbi:rod shape-determining protein MreC [Planctomycetota bacterium]